MNTGFTNQRFFNAKIPLQRCLDLTSARFIIRGFIKAGFAVTPAIKHCAQG